MREASRVSEFEAVLFDAGDTLIRLTGSGEKLLHRAAAELGAGPLDPDKVADVWQRVLDRREERSLHGRPEGR